MAPPRASLQAGGRGGAAISAQKQIKQERRGRAEEQEFEEGAHRQSLGE